MPRFLSSHSGENMLPRDDAISITTGRLVDLLTWSGKSGTLYNAVLHDDEEFSYVYTRPVSALADEVIAVHTLNFLLSAPEEFPARLSQMESAYVVEGYRADGISIPVYLALVGYYGGIASDELTEKHGSFSDEFRTF